MLDPADTWLPRAEHVWVSPPSITYERHAGILLAWRRNPEQPDTWQGWVVYVHPGIGARGDGPYVVQEWVPSDRVVSL